MKNIRYFLQRGKSFAGLTVLTFLLVSCGQAAQNITGGAQEHNKNAQGIKGYDISALYGYTFYGNITASKGETLKPSLILYNDNRAAWHMSIKWGGDAVQCYYYAVKNSTNNYTLYWYEAKERAAAMAHDTSKAYLVMKLGINSLDEIVTLRIDNSFMAKTRVPMQKQKDIARNTNPPDIP
jgi:hypothetical protein